MTLAAMMAVGLMTAGMAIVPASAAPLAAATPQMTITASTSTLVGLEVWANVNLTGGSNPTGTVTFKLFGPSDTTCGAAMFVSTVAVAGSSFNSQHFPTALAGTYRWQATYNGDANNNPVGPTACTNPSAAVIVSPREVGLSVTAQPFTAGTIAALAGIGGVSPTGTITFYLAGPADVFCSATPVFTAAVPVNGAGTYSSGAYRPTVTGTYKWRAIYSGDQNNMGGTVTACLDPNASVSVTSLGGAPVLVLNPVAVSFGPQVVGTTSPTRTITLSNTGTTGLGITSVNLTGANATDFRATGACSGTTVAPGSSCIISLTYSPTALGMSAASLVISDNAAPNNQSVALSGQSAAAKATLSYPTNGQANVDTSRAFTWNTTAAAQGYLLALGTTFGSYDLGLSGMLPPTQASFGMVALPTGTIYAILYTQMASGWSYDAITFTAIPTTSRLTYPTAGETGVATTGTFTWTGVAGAQNYYLTIGTTPAGYDLLDSRSLPASPTSYNVAGLPSGRTLHAVLYTLFNGVWTFQSLSFTTA